MSDATESRARDIAQVKGYAVIRANVNGVRGRLLLIDPLTQIGHAAADDWAQMLRYVRQITPLGAPKERIAEALDDLQKRCKA